MMRSYWSLWHLLIGFQISYIYSLALGASFSRARSIFRRFGRFCLSSNSEDEKRLRKAKNAADNKRKDADKPDSCKRLKSDSDNELFHGNILP